MATTLPTTLTRRTFAALLGLGGLATVAACSNNDPLGNTSAAPAASGKSASAALVVGSQQYYSNEIIAELFSQVLEKAGYQVKREYQIGQREIYLPEMEQGGIDVLPEYNGNLLQYFAKNASARKREDVDRALVGALPGGLRVLKSAEATDQDSYTVTKKLADQYQLTSIADLTKVPQPIKLAANSEFQTRPYGPDGAKETYGVDIQLVPVEDSGGPLTVKALTDGTVQVADIYTSEPSISKNGLVTLDDPEGLILPQNVIPVVSKKVDDKAAEAIESVMNKLSSDALRQLNADSVNGQKKSADVASAWLKSQGLA